jgi:hypothetical protein
MMHNCYFCCSSLARTGERIVLNYVTVTAFGICGSIDVGGCMPLGFEIPESQYEITLAAISRNEPQIRVKAGGLHLTLPPETYNDIFAAITKSKEMAIKGEKEPVMRPLKYPSPPNWREELRKRAKLDEK